VFVLTYWPWLPTLQAFINGDVKGSISDVIARILPWERGLYEDKVANVWCTLSPVFKFRERYSMQSLRRVCTLVTLCTCAPALAMLLHNGLTKSARTHAFALTLSIVSLSFYLCGYHVHEKSLLLPLLPMALLLAQHRNFVVFTMLVGHFSMFPLFIKDDNVTAYFALSILYYCANYDTRYVWQYGCSGFALACVAIIIHCLIAFVDPPRSLPGWWCSSGCMSRYLSF